MRHFALILAALATPTLAAHAPDDPQSLPYMDDRSTPQSVIESYYNAINRNEYARAYGYFGEGAAPGNFDQWQEGYSDTYWVDVSFGEVTEEGAAGSTYYTVPVHLEVESTEKQHSYFAGCYVLRLAQPAIQGVPFVPLHIESAHLQPSHSEITAFPDCASGTTEAAALAQ